ncbi:MAG: hypothetical protein PHS57_09335 [Alphaproteobacteria bacterium]|nr:hypothetical protein [Alphaproteobacteria bacterium]
MMNAALLYNAFQEFFDKEKWKSGQNVRGDELQSLPLRERTDEEKAAFIDILEKKYGLKATQIPSKSLGNINVVRVGPEKDSLDQLKALLYLGQPENWKNADKDGSPRKSISIGHLTPEQSACIDKLFKHKGIKYRSEFQLTPPPDMFLHIDGLENLGKTMDLLPTAFPDLLKSGATLTDRNKEEIDREMANPGFWQGDGTPLVNFYAEDRTPAEIGYIQGRLSSWGVESTLTQSQSLGNKLVVRVTGLDDILSLAGKLPSAMPKYAKLAEKLPSAEPQSPQRPHTPPRKPPTYDR